MKTIIKKSVPAFIFFVGLSASGICAATNTTGSNPSTALQTVTSKVNINTADAQQIAGKVSGIGLKKAEAIVAYRKEHGAYKSLDDLAQVKGIGESYVKKHGDALQQTFTL